MKIAKSPVVIVCETASKFLERTLPLLQREEVENNLILGLAMQIKEAGKPLDPKPFFAVVENEGQIEVAAMMTPPRSLILTSFAADPLDSLQALADLLWQEGWPMNGVNARPDIAEQFSAIWSHRATLKPIIHMHERIYRLDHVQMPLLPTGRFRQAALEDEEILSLWLDQFMQEALGENDPDTAAKVIHSRILKGTVFVWEDQQLFSMCARTRETPNGAVISMVYTPPAYRGKGYASAVVAHLSQLLLDSGFQFCALFTDLANPTSNKIYQAIGFYPVGDMDEYHFSKDL